MMSENNILTDLQLDAVGEVMNISMGSSATAVSELLNCKVWITTPKVSVVRVGDLNYDRLEPAIAVKIVYVKGLSGSNLMILKQDDVQLILNQLMGMPPVISPDFEFDELNISAVSEVMNQMMGASATALSDFLGTHIDISTPTPYILSDVKIGDLQELDDDTIVAAVNFDLTIDGVIKSEFISVLDVSLAEELANKLLTMSGMLTDDSAEPEPAPVPVPAPAPVPAPDMTQQMPQMPAPDMMMQQQMAMPQMPQMPTPDMMQQQMAMPQMPQMPTPDMMQQMPYGYPPYPNPMMYAQPPMQAMPMQPQVNYQNAQLAQFESMDVALGSEQKDNLKLLMGVPLQISVEIGSTTRKIKDILDFAQGTIIELERQAGAPVDVIVNGNLIARGDVVVIDDNFAVRITEIVKSKFIDSLSKEQGK